MPETIRDTLKEVQEPSINETELSFRSWTKLGDVSVYLFCAIPNSFLFNIVVLLPVSLSLYFS